ncbi:hypothetical protein NEMIN01_0890 [Nematocida minor]|uniref:uncharacterized protein n=1 Tax=Nematocida minor TaxID=1912983 RepID=UPI00221EBF8A|nr:uncharacterized protein NEMIN01_0890 [Nematocida minor]KAI5190191.1 hypothetical protein NEMIN01_0890 [Nematocida minor]
MDAFNLARELVGKKETEEDALLAQLQSVKEPVNFKGAVQLGKYLYRTEQNQLVSLAIAKSKPKNGVAHGMIEINGLCIYVFTNE